MAKVKCNNKKLKKVIANNKWYNPNTYTAFDSSLAYVVILLVFIGFELLLSLFLHFVKVNLDVFSLLGTMFLQLLIFFTAFIFSKVKKVGLFSGGGYHIKFDALDILFSIILIMGIMFMFMPLHMEFANDVNIGLRGIVDSNVPVEDIDIIAAICLLIMVFVVTPLFPCFFEEALFRGVIFRGLERRGTIFAIIVSSLMFSFMHGSFDQMLLQFLGGVAIASVVAITKNFFLGIIMHFVNNLFSSIGMIFLAFCSELSIRGGYLINALYIVIAIVMFISAVIYFGKKVVKKQKNNLLRIDNCTDRPTYCCIVEKSKINQEYESVRSDKIDVNKMVKSNDYLFYHKGDYYTFSKPKKAVWENLLMALGFTIAFAVILFATFH